MYSHHPHDQLLAELAAYPLTSEASFDLCATQLARDSKETHSLTLRLERELLPRHPGISVERLRLLQEQAWFGNDVEKQPLSLVSHILRLAQHHLAPAGPRVRLRDDCYPEQHALSWLWLVRYIPADLLVAARYAQLQEIPADAHVLLSSPQLREILQEPCAETHLHLGAALSFPTIWTGLVYALAQDSPTGLLSRNRNELMPSPLGNPQRWVKTLYAALILRVLFASFLWDRTIGRTHTFSEFCSRRGPLFFDICRRIPWADSPDTVFALLGEIIASFFTHSERNSPFTRYQQIYSALIRHYPPTAVKITSLSQLRQTDPLSDWLPCQAGYADPEVQLASLALQYLIEPGAKDAEFARLFWQYQRIRSLTYCDLVQSPGISGLDWFTRIYGKISRLSKPIKSILAGCALELESRDLNLGSIELRSSPHEKWSQNRDFIRDMARQAQLFTPRIGARRPEFGLILHFLKERMDRIGKCANAAPAGVTTPTRHGRWFYRRRAEAEALAKMLQVVPETLLLFRGLDVASVEQAQPTWVILPLFERVREAARRAAMVLARQKPLWNIPPLRATIHAGEDFTRLIEGLRRMHEPIEFQLLMLGDRLGHGVALGIDPDRWAQNNRIILQCEEDRLDDLLWELARYCDGSINCTASRLAYVQAQIAHLSRRIFGDEATPSNEELLYLRQLLHQPGKLESLRYPYPPELVSGSERNSRIEQLLRRYLTDLSVYERGRRTIQVHCDSGEVDVLNAAQAFLRAKIGRLEITVECNPSSNLLIGGFNSLDQIPVFRLVPLATTCVGSVPPMLVSINSDDPVSFSSCLADEYAHIYYSLLRQGIASGDALAWLHGVREMGWRSKFTLAASSDENALNMIAGSTFARMY